MKDLISDNGKFLPFDVFCRMFDVKACFTTYYGLCSSIRQNWNAISKESHGVLELISNWRTNNSNLTTAVLLLQPNKKFLIQVFLKITYQRYIFYHGV